MMPSIPQIILILFILFVVIGLFILPIVFVAKSDRTSGAAKVAWIIAAILFSWLAYIVLQVSTRDQANVQPRDQE